MKMVMNIEREPVCTRAGLSMRPTEEIASVNELNLLHPLTCFYSHSLNWKKKKVHEGEESGG